jgi:hypothetical protein
MEVRSRERRKAVADFFSAKIKRIQKEKKKTFSSCEHGTDIRFSECDECLEEFNANEHRRHEAARSDRKGLAGIARAVTSGKKRAKRVARPRRSKA